MSSSRAVEKMRAAGLPEAAIAAFEQRLAQVEAGASGLVSSDELTPLDDVPDASAFPDAIDRDALDRAVNIKLNGGLGTSMGVTGPKSLLEAKDGQTFLDLIARQTLALRSRHGVRLPLVLMNSFATSEQSLAALARHPGIEADVPLEFLQNRQPKLRADDLEPVEWPADPRLEWCPPGHGDFYTALLGSGMLEKLLSRGYRYAFVSNSDNLGAVLDPRLLTWFAAEEAPFMMEAIIGTEAERKGGHIARRRSDGRIILREIAQTPPEEAESFRDFRRWRYYNSNTLWLDLEALSRELDASGGALDLPVIVNRKTVDPRDPGTPEVLQLETAMGAAIGLFEGARVVCVPRARFAPVKTTDDLLLLRSDAYGVTEDALVEAVAPVLAYVELDPRHYKTVAAFENRFPHGPPSLRDCRRFVVEGDVTFGSGVIARGEVHVRAGSGPMTIPDGTLLEH
jgi:UTP--glucose-1-phosphate uridylyltransferase